MGNHATARGNWLLVATATSGLAYGLPNWLLKPLATYAGLPLDSRPHWWIVLAAVLSAVITLLFIMDFRRKGAPRVVAWGPLVFVVLSQAFWPLIGGGGTSSVPWPLWILSTALLVGAGFAAVRIAPAAESSPPEREMLVVSWLWAVLMLSVAAWSIYAIAR